MGIIKFEVDMKQYHAEGLDEKFKTIGLKFEKAITCDYRITTDSEEDVAPEKIAFIGDILVNIDTLRSITITGVYDEGKLQKAYEAIIPWYAFKSRLTGFYEDSLQDINIILGNNIPITRVLTYETKDESRLDKEKIRKIIKALI